MEKEDDSFHREENQKIMSKYYDMPVCDLRFISSVEEAKEIEAIFDIAMLILPKNASPEVMSAIAGIEKYDIVNTVYLDCDTEITTINGTAVINNNSVSANQEHCFVVNGMVFVESLPENGKIRLIANGGVVIKKSLKESNTIIFDSVNGSIQYLDFEDYKTFPNILELDIETISYIKENTLIFVGNQLIFKNEVTVDVIRDKNIQFFVGNEIHCPKHLAPYLKMNATVGNQIVIE